MIKILTISNAHQWDGVEMSLADFTKLCEVLGLSKFTHAIKYVEDGSEKLGYAG